MLPCSALLLHKSHLISHPVSFFFLNYLLNCCYKAANLNRNSFSLFLSVCGRKKCCLTSELFKGRHPKASLKEDILEMAGVQSQRRKYVQAIKGRDLGEYLGSP